MPRTIAHGLKTRACTGWRPSKPAGVSAADKVRLQILVRVVQRHLQKLGGLAAYHRNQTGERDLAPCYQHTVRTARTSPSKQRCHLWSEGGRTDGATSRYEEPQASLASSVHLYHADRRNIESRDPEQSRETHETHSVKKFGAPGVCP